MTARWNPDQYLKFGEQRLRPALELLGRIPVESPRVICDLGCGTGNITRLVAERWPDAKITGIDNSAEMLDSARQASTDIEWVEADIARWIPPEEPDLVFSNAALHWIANHDTLIPRLFGMLRQGGCLAVQMPLSDELPSHRLMRETLSEVAGEAAAKPFCRRVEAPYAYHAMLAAEAQSIDLWTTEYLQQLEGDDAVFEWVRGTALVPVLATLDDETRDRFVREYRLRLREAYPRAGNGYTLYPFRRLFLVATR